MLSTQEMFIITRNKRVHLRDLKGRSDAFKYLHFIMSDNTVSRRKPLRFKSQTITK